MTSRRRSIWLLTALATPTPPTSSAARPTKVRNWVKRLMVRSSCGEALPRLRISQPASGNELDRKRNSLDSNHQDLHSFPTRRSSDLADQSEELGETANGALELRRSVAAAADLPARLGQRTRSEEEQSRLQSPRSTLFPYTTLFRSGRPK